MKKQKFHDGWRVYRDADAFSLVYAVPADAVEVTLPYDRMWFDEQIPDGVTGGRCSYLEGGTYHYYKEWFVPAEERTRKHILHCDGIFTKSFVYLNGSLVGSGDFGYVGYDCELDDYLKFGENNALLIVAKTPILSSRWYSGGGVCRALWMYEADRVYVKPDSLYVRAADVRADGIALDLSVALCNRMPQAEDLTVRFRCCDGEQCVLSRDFTVRIRGGAEYALDHRVFLPGGVCWSEDNPKLYTCQVEILAGDEILDSEEQTTGFRMLSWNAREGLLVNGEVVKLRGACLHHDEGILGGVSYLDFELRRIGRLKAAGFNAVRSAHNHATPELLQACDRLGVFVLDELCDMWTKMKVYEDYTQFFRHTYQDSVRTMVVEDRIHPCVVGYSTGNEISDICTQKGIETSHELYGCFHELDSTRFVTNGINGAFAAGDNLMAIAADLTGQPASDFADGDVNKFMMLMGTRMNDIVQHPVITGILEQLDVSMDIAGYNYMTYRYAKDAAAYPDRLMLGTETYPRQIAENWKTITAHSACVGDFTWTGWDYMGELGEPYPAWNNPAGDLDSFGNRRPVSYYREIVFGLRKTPYLCVRGPKSIGVPRQFGPWCFTDAVESWTFADAEFGEHTDKKLDVEIYAAGDEVELFLNDVSLGKYACGPDTDYYTIVPVAYAPGTLRCVSYDKGAVLGEAVLQTTGAACRLAYSIERYDDQPGSEGLVFVNICAQDADGKQVPGSGQTLHLDVSCGRLLGFGSLGAKHDRGFLNQDITFTGATALAVLQADAGKVALKVTADGLEGIEIA